MKKNIWFIMGGAILLLLALLVVSNLISVWLWQKTVPTSPPPTLGALSPVSTSTRQSVSPVSAVGTATVSMITPPSTAEPVTSPAVTPTPRATLTLTPAATSTLTPTPIPTLSPDQVEDLLRPIDAHIMALDLLIQTTPPTETDDDGDGRIDRQDYDLGQAGYVVITSREKDGYFDLAQYDLDGDGDVDAAKFDLDRVPGFDEILYDIDGNGRADHRRDDVNLDGVFESDEVFYYSAEKHRWLPVVEGAVWPPYSSLPPYLFPLPFYYP